MTPNPVELAYRAASAGRLDEAVATLTAAEGHGDALAAAELAVWYLRGDIVPRDLSRARAMLRRAVSIGHVDAALMEVALTANGSGGSPDWPKALELLTAAAVGDAVAAQHLALIDKMSLDRDGNPSTIPVGQQLSSTPFVERFEGALSPDECRHIAELTHDKLAPAVVVDPRTGRNISHPIRTSDGTLIGPVEETLAIAALNRRFAALTRTTVDQGEPLSVLRYAPGQQYRPHLDALTGTDNQRIVTAIAYLNDGFDGGETWFESNKLSVRPRAGDVLVFRNVLPNGAADPASRHAGLPVRRGTKWIATRWIRDQRYDPWTYHEGK